MYIYIYMYIAHKEVILPGWGGTRSFPDVWQMA